MEKRGKQQIQEKISLSRKNTKGLSRQSEIDKQTSAESSGQNHQILSELKNLQKNREKYDRSEQEAIEFYTSKKRQEYKQQKQLKIENQVKQTI